MIEWAGLEWTELFWYANNEKPAPDSRAEAYGHFQEKQTGEFTKNVHNAQHKHIHRSNEFK